MVDTELLYLQTVDEDLDKIGVTFVYLEDDSLAEKLLVKEFPALVYFRNGDPIIFEGQVENEMAVIKVLPVVTMQYRFFSLLILHCNEGKP